MSTSVTLPDLDAHFTRLAAGLEIVALRRLRDRDDARDAVQETLARLLERVRSGALQNDDELAPLAYGIARHVIADVLRRRNRAESAIGDASSAAPSALELIVREDERVTVQQALQQLPQSDRTLLQQCFVDGERIGEIAVRLGEPAERVRKRKSRALQRLARLLGSPSPGHEIALTPMDQQ